MEASHGITCSVFGLIHGNKCDESVSSVVQLSMTTVVGIVTTMNDDERPRGLVSLAFWQME